MGKECFTCMNKLTTELTPEQRKQMREDEIKKGNYQDSDDVFNELDTKYFRK